MRPHRTPGLAARLCVGLVAAALVAAGCGSAAVSAPPSANPSTAPSTAPSTQPSGSGGASGSDADAQIAALKAKLDGQKLRIGKSSFVDVQSLNAYRTVDFLKSEFGVDAQLQELDSNAMVAAMVAGQADVGWLSLAASAAVADAGLDILAFAGDFQKNPFVVAAKAPMSDLSEVKGKRLATTLSTTGATHQTLVGCLKSVGLDVERDVELLKLGNAGETTEAIVNGQVAAGVSQVTRISKLNLTEPNAYNILCKGWETVPLMADVWFASPEWVEQNHDMALALTISELLASRWAKSNQSEWIAYNVEKVPNQTEEVAARDYEIVVEELDAWPVNGSLDRSITDATLKTTFESGAVKKNYTTDDLVTFAIQDEALSIVGAQ